jgi:hypothetical protein
VCSATDDNASDRVALLLFALFCFIVAAYAFFATCIAVQIWLAATILLRLCRSRYIRAALWSCALVFLINIDAVRFFKTDARALLCWRLLSRGVVVDQHTRHTHPLAQLCARVGYINGLQENSKREESASKEVQPELKALAEQCRNSTERSR